MLRCSFLAVIFDEKMHWDNHIKSVKAKISFKFSIIKAIAWCLNEDAKVISTTAHQHGPMLLSVEWANLIEKLQEIKNTCVAYGGKTLTLSMENNTREP